MSYSFRKVYADVLAPDGTLCVVYLAWVHLLGRWHGRSGAEVYAPDGTRTTHEGEEIAPVARADFDPTRIVVALPRGQLVLQYQAEAEAFSPAPPAACPSLSWSVLVPRATALIASPDLGRHEGVGYVDWVALSRPTRLLGLRELRWGRAHLREATIAFTALDFADGREWRSGAVWSAPSRAPAPGDVASELDAAGNMRVRIGASVIALRAERLLHQGDAFGKDRVRNPVERLVAHALGGRTRETRWLGTASLGGNQGRAVYERVRFGAAATGPR